MPGFFFRPTPYGSRQVVYQAGKPVAFCKFTELMQWQHHHDDNVNQKENWIGSIHNPLSCHRAKQKENQQKQKTTKTETQTKQTQPKKNARPVISTSVHGQLKRIRRDDSIASPLGLVWHVKTRAKQQHDNAIQNLWARKQQRHKAETEAPLQPGASRSLSHGQHSHRFRTPSKGQLWHYHVAKGKWQLTIVKRSVKTDLGETIEATPALRGHSDSSQVCHCKCQDCVGIPPFGIFGGTLGRTTHTVRERLGAPP